MTSDFYRAFEDRYRGSRELIKSRLQVYVPFIQSLLTHYPGGHAVDLGCGRGEWLELVAELGLSATGVDLDDGMLAACRERGLNVTTGDGLALLKSLPDCSQVVVSGFHFAEHIPFDSLMAVVKEALRVLQPGGLLVLETPNPENIAVGTCHFYLDPSHQRPIPPQLLSFVTEYQGFARTKILRLQESAELSGDVAVALTDVFTGVSPDYAVVAQKDAEPHVLAATTPAFQREYGVGLEMLAHRYDEQSRAAGQFALTKTREAETRAAQAEIKANQAEIKAAQAESIALEAAARATQAEAHAREAATMAQDTAAQLGNVLASTSWRVTKPLRWMRASVFRPGQALSRVTRIFLRRNK